MEAGGEALDVERMLAFEAFADRLQNGHFLRGPLDLAPAVVGELEVLDIVSLRGNGGHKLLRPRAVERNHDDKRTQPPVDLVRIGLNDAAHTEVFHRERAEAAAVEHPAPEQVLPLVSAPRHGAPQPASGARSSTASCSSGWIVARNTSFESR